MHTNQSVFDRVVKHLLKQNQKARNKDTGSCLYRTDEGLRCAAGCLIPKRSYRPSMENKRASILPFFQRNYKDQLNLIVSLQTVHDTVDVDDWPGELKIIAREHRLRQPDILKAR